MRSSYCSANNVVHRRDESADRARAQEARQSPDIESERFAKLRSQDQGPTPLPESLRPWLDCSALNRSFLADAQKDWQWARRELADGSGAFYVAERFFHLTVLIADHLDPRRRRASLETAAELLTDTRHRHVVRCMLARLAAQYGDATGARAWLETCNSRPQDLVMDTAYRYAAATLGTAERNYPKVFEQVGRRLGDGQQFACELWRANALEHTGQVADAAAELRSWMRTHGADAVRWAVDAHRPLVLCAQAFAAAGHAADSAELDRLVAERRALSTGAMAFSIIARYTPLRALALMIPIAVIRCSADVDPLMGVYGIPLCPRVCDGCTGPTRTVTVWSQTGPGEWSSNGAEYYCQPPGHSFDTMSADQLKASRRDLAGAELGWVAASGATFIVLFVLLLPGVPIAGLLRHLKTSRRAASLDRQIHAIIARSGSPLPRQAARGRSRWRRLGPSPSSSCRSGWRP